MKKALVLGSTGQDGSYICENLLKNDYKVFALVRKSATGNLINIKNLIDNKKIYEKNFFLVRGDLNDYVSISSLIKKINPDEIYNFADQDSIGWSFSIPIYSFTTTSQSIINIFETIKIVNRNIKYFQPLSSNMFGISKKKTQNENTVFNPQSIYALSKVASFYICKFYRDIYKLKIYGAIFYNHESPRRSNEYVTKKIVNNVCEIYLKKRKFLELGDIKAKIDWGYAFDYVNYARIIMQQKKPDFFVIATGKANTVKDFAIKCFKYLNLNWKKYLKVNKKFLRPSATSVLIGDVTKAKKILNYKVDCNLDKLIKIMMDSELEKLR
jgi:GDPmannose 4,6-dehydratase